MALRLVLVGLVVGLGLTLPGRRERDAWGYSAQRWVNARLAEWDTRTPADPGAFVLVSEPAETAAPTPDEPAPMGVSDEAFAAVIDETVAAFALEQLAARPAPADEPARPADELGPPLGGSESLAIAPPTDPSLDGLDQIPMEDLAFNSVVEEMASIFSGDLDRTRRAAEDLAFETLLDEMVVAFVTEPPAPSRVEVEEAPAAPRTETIALDEDLYAGEAYALNRLSDGLELPAAPAPAEPVVRGSRLTDAVRLTREAVFAWASLLHGPAVVTISQ